MLASNDTLLAATEMQTPPGKTGNAQDIGGGAGSTHTHPSLNGGEDKQPTTDALQFRCG